MGSIAYWHHESLLLYATSWQLPNTNQCLWMAEQKVTRKERQPGRDLHVGFAQQ